MKGAHVAASGNHRAQWWALSATLCTAAVLCFLLARGEAPTAADAAAARLSGSAAGRPAQVPGASARRNPPVRLSIPAIAVSEPLLRLGLNRDGTVEVPAPEKAVYPGWFALGPAPGQAGSAVVLGHVDSLRGPAVFYQLRLLRAGDRVDVQLRDGSHVAFSVEDVATYSHAHFPAARVYRSGGRPALTLVTCGGAYDPKTGYQANVVVYTRLLRPTL